MITSTAWGLRKLKQFRDDNRASAAVEFAIVALPFFILLFAAIDFGLMMFASSTLENGIASAARRIKTGQVAANGITAQQFRQLVCNDVSMLMTCDARLAVDVRVFNNFANVNFPAAVDGNGNLVGNFQYQTGTAGDIVLVRAFYSWRMLTPGFGEAMANMNGGARLIQATTAFRNEPFGAILP